METSQCHRNSYNIYLDNPDDNILATGYALSDNGMWRQHSWVVKKGKKNNEIIETTVERVLYFGIVLNKTESNIFSTLL